MDSRIICILIGIVLAMLIITRRRPLVVQFGPHATTSIKIGIGILSSWMVNVCYPTAAIRKGSIVRDKNLEYVSVASLLAAVIVCEGASA